MNAVTLAEADLADAEVAANADNLARFAQGIIKTRAQPFWIYDDITLGADVSLLNNVAMDVPLYLPREGTSLSWIFGLTVNMVNLRTPHFLDQGGYALTQDDLLGANLFNGLHVYGDGWRIMAGINLTITDHSIYHDKLFSPFFFSDFSLLGKLIRPALEWTLPSEFSALFSRLSLKTLTPFGTPSLTLLKIIGGSNATLSYTFDLPGSMDFNVTEGWFKLSRLKGEVFAARNWDVLSSGTGGFAAVQERDSLTRFLAWESQIIHLTAYAPLEDTTEQQGRIFFTLAYNGRDGFGFRTGVDAPYGALILTVNSYLEGYHTTTLGKFSLYFRMAAEFEEERNRWRRSW